MRNVLRSSNEVVHYWAHQVQKSGRTGNMRFDGPVLYSYREPIARIFEQGVLFTTRKWSATTNSHLSSARGAASHLPYVFATNVWDYSEESLHRSNKTSWQDTLERHLDELKNHPRRKVSVGRKIETVLQQRDAYRTFFKLDWEDSNVGVMAAEIESRNAQRQAEAEQHRLDELERRAKREVEQAEQLVRWRAGEPLSTTFIATACRVTGDEVETTHGARFPTAHAADLWPVLCRYFLQHRTYRRNGHTIHLGVYALDSFNEDMGGTLSAGCHTVKWEELENIAALLKLPPCSSYLDSSLEAA